MHSKPKRYLLGLLLLMSALSASAADTTPLSWVFASDPQYPWTERSDNNQDESKSDKYANSRALLEAQYGNIADFRRVHGGAPAVPVMINGDMTAFGHSDERRFMSSFLPRILQNNYDYGLGNHDYQNNINDCFLNNCAGGSLRDFIGRYQVQAGSMDLTVRGAGGERFYGSLAYSKGFGDVHVIQLNNEPTYSVTFTAGSVLTLNKVRYEVTPSLDWLERDLKKARAQGKVIILNMHKPADWAQGYALGGRFREMIERYGVTAVFAGHYHQRSGAYTRPDYFGNVPVFVSGSASQQTWLTADFSADMKTLTVSRVSGNNWRARSVEAVVEVKR